MKPTFEVQVRTEVHAKTLGEVLAAALNDGSVYWINHVKWKWPVGATPRMSLTALLFEYGGAVHIWQIEENTPCALDMNVVEQGLKTMSEKYPKHTWDLLSENDDATTADVFLQCCLFGDIKYS